MLHISPQDEELRAGLSYLLATSTLPLCSTVGKGGELARHPTGFHIPEC